MCASRLGFLRDCVALLRRNDGAEILRPVTGDLIRRFDDPNARVRANLMRGIALLQPAPPYAAVEGFTNHLKDPDSEVKRLAVYGLVKAAPVSLSAADAVGGLLDSTSDPEARRELVQVLGAAKPAHPVIIGELVKHLDGESGPLRLAAVRTSGETGPPAAQAIHELRATASFLQPVPATSRTLQSPSGRTPEFSVAGK